MELLKPLILSKEKKDKRRRTVKRNGLFSKIARKKKYSENKRNRDKEIKHRKNFLPSLVATILFWIVFFYIIYSINPLDKGAVQIFFISAFLSLLFTLSLIFKNSRRGLLFTISIVLLLILRYFGIGNIINILLVSGLAVTIEIYFSKN